MPEERTRWQKVWDSVLIGAGGTTAAAMVLGLITGGWSIYTGIARVETMQKAMNLVISEKLARIDSERVDKLERRLQASEVQHEKEMKLLLDMLVEEGDPEELKRILISKKPRPDVQVQDTNQNQEPPAWRQHQRRKRETQEQIQQQYEMLK